MFENTEQKAKLKRTKWAKTASKQLTEAIKKSQLVENKLQTIQHKANTSQKQSSD